MEQEILEIIAEYGVHTVVIALIINLLTNFLKKPIKAYSKKSGKNANKYISFIPIILGFGAAVVYLGLTKGWNLKVDEVIALSISASSLSLAMFAIIEKFINGNATHSKEKLISQEETCNIMEIDNATNNDTQAEVQTKENTITPLNKIILGRKVDETETKES